SVLRGRSALQGYIVTDVGGTPSDPGHGEMYANAARVHAALGSLDLALRNFRASTLGGHDHASVNFEMARLHARRREWMAALARVRHGLWLAPRGIHA